MIGISQLKLQVKYISKFLQDDHRTLLQKIKLNNGKIKMIWKN